MASFFRLDQRRKLVVNGPVQRRMVASIALPMLAILLVVLCTQIVIDHKVRAGTLDVDGRILGVPERSLSAVLFFVFAMAYQIVHALRISNRIASRRRSIAIFADA